MTFHGEFFTVDSASIGPRPAKPPDIWLGGSAPGALRRAGRLADGWLASSSPGGSGRWPRGHPGRRGRADREIEPDHFGISLAVATGPALAALHTVARQRRRNTDPAELVAVGWADARGKIEDYVAAAHQFVIRPGAGRADPAQFAGRVRPRDDPAADMTRRGRSPPTTTQCG